MGNQPKNNACVFNEGFMSLLKIMQIMIITIGPATIRHAERMDVARIKQTNRHSTDASKQVKPVRRNEKWRIEETYPEEERILCRHRRLNAGKVFFKQYF